MATSSTNAWVIVNEHGSYWDGGDNWYPDLIKADVYDAKQLAKDFYRDTHGTFPRNFDAVELTDQQWQDLLDAQYRAGRAEVAGRPGTEVAVVDAEVIDGEVEDDELEKLAAAANQLHAAFEAAGRTALAAAWNCGQALLAAKAEVEAAWGHGEWKRWLETEFTGSYRTAAVYMQIASNVQTSALSEFDSISGVLKAIAEAKKGGTTARAERTLDKRAANVAKAAGRLAAILDELASDIDADGGECPASVLGYLDSAETVLTQAFRAVAAVST